MTAPCLIVPSFDSVPAALRERAQWVLWRLVHRPRAKKPPKIPFGPSGAAASTTDPATWSTFDEVRAAYGTGGFDGVGFVFTADDPFVGIDLDLCRDPATGELTPTAQAAIARFETYCEISPSGTGIHLILVGKLPPGGRKRGPVECYEQDRYFTVTARSPEGVPVRDVVDRTSVLAAWHAEAYPAQAPVARPAPAVPVITPLDDDDDRIIERARNAKNGEKFRTLFDRGDCSGYDSESEATLALCSLLAYRTDGDVAAVDRLFRRSKLMREKWDAPRGDSTWGLRTITTAIQGLRMTPPATPAPAGATRHVEASTDVFTPGAHRTANDEYFEVGTDDFARAVLGTFADDVLYRMDHVVGQIVGEPGLRRFVALEPNDLRLRIDERARLVRWAKDRETKEQEKVFVACSKDHAGLVLAAAAVSSRVRELQQLVNYPVYLPGVELARPGWNARGGVFYDEPPDLAGLVPKAHGALDVLNDLVIDFPLKDEASRQNVYGMMLTALLRPAIEGPIPFHLVMASLERTGKGKLIDATLGQVVRGRQVQLIQLAPTEEEREKRVTSLILQGATAIHFDNVPGGEVVDSPALASLATAWPRWCGRLLGASSAPDLPNRILVALSGNNVRATGELCKRTVPIVLESRTPTPELRSDFKHQDIMAYARGERRAVLGALIGVVEAWKHAGMPGTTRRMGGFELWVAAVGGALASAGADQWMTNYEGWVRLADDASADALTLVEAWAQRHGTAEVTATQVLSLVEETHTYQQVLVNPNAHGRVISLRRRVLDQLVDRPVGRWLVRRRPSGSSSTYFLVAGMP